MAEYATLRTDYREHIPHYLVFDRSDSLVIATSNRRLAELYLRWAAKGFNPRQIAWINDRLGKAPLRR